MTALGTPWAAVGRPVGLVVKVYLLHSCRSGVRFPLSPWEFSGWSHSSDFNIGSCLNIYCSPAPPTSHSERESGQTTLRSPQALRKPEGLEIHCHLHRGDWSFHLTNEMKKERKLAVQRQPCQTPGDIGSAVGLVVRVSVYRDWMR